LTLINRMLNKNIKIIVNYLLGPVVFLVLIWFIRQQIIRQPDWRSSIDQIGNAVSGPGWWRLLLVILLMPVNWGIEARKWQLAMRPDGGVSFNHAFKAIFTGATMASFTPNRMGEYLGRILYVKEGRRVAAISLTMICSIAQLLVTLILGVFGLTALFPLLSRWSLAGHPDLIQGLPLTLTVVCVLLLGLGFLYFQFPRITRCLARIPGMSASGPFRNLSAFIKVLENFDRSILLRILFLSFVRYIVFIVQYSLVFPVFSVGLGFGQVWEGMSVVFLIMAVVPTFTFLTELGLRLGASFTVLELYHGNTVGIFAASFTIWLVNLVIPALIGSLLIVRIKLFKSR
jgi:lysylphosphatidylglycerol synthase-like protein